MSYLDSPPVMAERPGDGAPIVAWGTYDLGKPRVRILLRGLRENGVAVHECHADVWAGVEDKSQLSGILPRLGRLARWLASYPKLISGYLKAPRHEIVLVPYMGHLDVIVLWPFAKWRGASIVWDAYLSLYSTIVEDRRVLSPSSLRAHVVYLWEWLATRAADLTILDTHAHASYFRDRYGVPDARLGVVFVGAETDVFPPQPPRVPRPPGMARVVLFYGQFIPLQGVEIIVEAARRLDDGSIRWILIGDGQEAGKIRTMLMEHPVCNLEWHPWVCYKELIEWIGRADICLGIFGDSDKAGRVIPNKFFQFLSAGRTIISRDSPAVRELVDPGEPGILLVPPGSSDALVWAIEELVSAAKPAMLGPLFEQVVPRIRPVAIARQLLAAIRPLYAKQPG